MRMLWVHMDWKILNMRNYYRQDGHSFWVEKMCLIIGNMNDLQNAY